MTMVIIKNGILRKVRFNNVADENKKVSVLKMREVRAQRKEDNKGFKNRA